MPWRGLGAVAGDAVEPAPATDAGSDAAGAATAGCGGDRLASQRPAVLGR